MQWGPLDGIGCADWPPPETSWRGPARVPWPPLLQQGKTASAPSPSRWSPSDHGPVDPSSALNKKLGCWGATCVLRQVQGRSHLLPEARSADLPFAREVVERVGTGRCFAARLCHRVPLSQMQTGAGVGQGPRYRCWLDGMCRSLDPLARIEYFFG